MTKRKGLIDNEHWKSFLTKYPFVIEISPDRDIFFNIDTILHSFFAKKSLYKLVASKILPLLNWNKAYWNCWFIRSNVPSHIGFLTISIWAVPYAYGSAYAYRQPICVREDHMSMGSPYAFGLLICIGLTHIDIAGSPYLAHMHMSNHMNISIFHHKHIAR